MEKIQINWKGVLLGTLVVVSLCSCGKEPVYYEEEETVVSEMVVNSQSEENALKKDIYVYVCGQVLTPGVYILPEGSRICDAFAMAGGFTAEAAEDYWNQARVLKDGEMLYVPTAEDVENSQFKTEAINETEANKVNINTASKEELMTIPGIGEIRALAILSYRQENGAFTSIEELKNVEGIKDGVFSKIKDYIVIN